MSPIERLQKLASHFTTAAPYAEDTSKTHPDDSHEYHHRNNYHTLSPTSFLWRAAQIEPHVSLPDPETPPPAQGYATSLCKIPYVPSEGRGLISLLHRPLQFTTKLRITKLFDAPILKLPIVREASHTTSVSISMRASVSFVQIRPPSSRLFSVLLRRVQCPSRLTIV